MANEKLTELTKVSSGGTGSLFYMVDPNRAAGDQSVSVDKDDVASIIGAGSGGGIPDGGTTGQVLKKLSNTDGDAGWENESGANSPTELLTGTDLQVDNNTKGKIYNETTPSTANSFEVDAILTGGYVENYIDTTGKSDFPTINNMFGIATQTASNDFQADTIFKMIVRAKNATDVEYFFVNYLGNTASQTGLPAPTLLRLVQTSLLPSQTQELDIYSDYITNNTTVLVESQTVDSVSYRFDSNNVPYLECSITTGATESEFDLTLNNGQETVFVDAIIVNVGQVFIPTESDWINTTNAINVSQTGAAKITGLNLNQSARWNRELDWTKDFYLQFTFNASPFGDVTNDFNGKHVQIRNVSNNAEVFTVGGWNYENGNVVIRGRGSNNLGADVGGNGVSTPEEVANWFAARPVEIRWVSGVLSFWTSGVIRYTSAITLTENVYPYINDLDSIDVVDIKYIELP